MVPYNNKVVTVTFHNSGRCRSSYWSGSSEQRQQISTGFRHQLQQQHVQFLLNHGPAPAQLPAP